MSINTSFSFSGMAAISNSVELNKTARFDLFFLIFTSFIVELLSILPRYHSKNYTNQHIDYTSTIH